jgi:hypothetical protein
MVPESLLLAAGVTKKSHLWPREVLCANDLGGNYVLLIQAKKYTFFCSRETTCAFDFGEKICTYDLAKKYALFISVKYALPVMLTTCTSDLV